MADETDIDNKAPEAPEDPGTVQATEAIPAVAEPGTITPNQAIENMETHAHHLHHAPGKKIWHYFYEFLMLFLAVFCGFLAENWREHLAERQREKQYIQSLVSDLKSDQQILANHVQELKTGIAMMDSMINLLNEPALIPGNTGQLYYLARIGPRLRPLSTNSRTYEQLKNSGNFRLIEDIGTSDKVMTYYEKFPLIRLLESINENEFTEYKKYVAKVFDPAILLKMEGDKNQIIRITENPPLRTTDHEVLQELSVFCVYLQGTKKGMLTADKELEAAGTELIGYLQKQYHLA